jgi:hypothetical protein
MKSTPGRTLEERVDEKARQLKGAQEEMLRVERMTSIGKLAAVVAQKSTIPSRGSSPAPSC